MARDPFKKMMTNVNMSSQNQGSTRGNLNSKLKRELAVSKEGRIYRYKKQLEVGITRDDLEEQFKKIEEIWSGDTKYKSATDLAEAMGYKRSHSNVYSVEKLLKKYNEAKGLDLAVDDVIELVGETNRPKFSKVGEELRATIVSDYEDAIKG